ncbi:MAG: YceI family protein [Actinomycetales bacterium]|nr:YceI family protein [Actinomycetales bacterium]
MSDLTNYSGTWAVDPTHSRLGFEARHAVITKVRGHFADFTGTLVINADDISASSAKIVAQLASVDTANADRDGHLRSADFFDVEKNPELQFASKNFVQSGDDYLVTGDLTINGITNPIELKVELTGTATDPFGNSRAGFEVSGELSRKDFGLVWNVALEAGGLLVSDTIKLQIDISAIKQG